MSNTDESNNTPVTLVGLLQIVFVTLKLCGVINWSWWWVMAPLWMSVSIYVFLVVIIAGLYFYLSNK